MGLPQKERAYPLKILFLQDHLRNGGAARAARRWEDLLCRQGHVNMVVAGDESTAGGYPLSGKPPRGWGRVKEFFAVGRGRREEKVRAEFSLILRREKPELVWCHNLAGGQKWGWGEFLVAMAREQGPVLWTFHDMWPLGERQESYWQPPRGGEGRGRSRLEKACGEKGFAHPVALTAPSVWLCDLTQKLTGYPCCTLPNPIDLELYRPGDRKQAREKLGLPQTDFLVLAGADSLKDIRKGFDLLQAAWAGLKLGKATLVLFGRHGVSEPGTRYLGPIDSDAMMIHAYQAADLYVHPARMENASCQIQEAMACGIPTLAFATGGNAELIQTGQSGLLAARVDAESLAAELERAWKLGPGLEAMGGKARQRAMAIWGPDRLIRMWEETLRPALTGPR